MQKFNIGDRVEITNEDGKYYHTKDGSVGVIIEFECDSATIEFTLITGDPIKVPVTFGGISLDYLKLKPWTKLEKAVK